MNYVFDIQCNGYLDYEQLFKRCIQNPGNFIVLDYYIALRSLRDGYDCQEVALMLMQSPYVRQQKENQAQSLRYVESRITHAQKHFQQQSSALAIRKLFAMLKSLLWNH